MISSKSGEVIYHDESRMFMWESSPTFIKGAQINAVHSQIQKICL